MPIESMTPKERWEAVLNRQQPDRIPMDYWGTPEVSARLIRHFGLSDKSEGEIIVGLSPKRSFPGTSEIPKSRIFEREALKRLNIDFVIRLEANYIGPQPELGSDAFGCRYRLVDYGEGVYIECIHSPLAEYNSVEEIEQNYTWPEPNWWDYSTILQQIEGYEDYPIRAGGSEPFLFYKYLRGDSQAFMDLVIQPEIVHYCLDKLFDLAYENTRRMYEQISNISNKLVLTYVNEDLGSQNGLIYSPQHIREFLFPRMKRMIDLAHNAGGYVFHHDDGSIRRIIPELIDLGIDILNPVQWRLKDMAREDLKQEFGENLIFHGGVDNQHTMPFGSINDVRKEVIDNIKILGDGGGYIIAPCHNIQPNTPIENILALYETGFEYGFA
jgi:uroporphyrinogen decarboxylase